MEKTITRADIVTELMSFAAISRQQATEILEEVLTTITDSLTAGDTVKISSFGTFSVREKKERLGRNPRTGEDAPISSRRVITFRASPLFKNAVQKKLKG
jgi:integration host factor subunit alpha